MNGFVRARDNPFATWRLHEIRFRSPSFCWNEFQSHWAALHFQAAIVGPHGSGKTQLLEEFSQRLKNQGHSVKTLRLNANQRWDNWISYRRFISKMNAEDFVFLDGAEQLNPLLWRILKGRAQACRGLLITTHQPGHLQTALQCSVSLSLLDELMKELMGNEAEIWRQPAHRLFEKHQGNLREVFRALYDEYSETPSVGHVDIPTE